MTALVAVLLAVLLAVPSPASAAPATPATPGAYVAQVVDATNDVRAGNGLRRLGVDGCLQRTARRQAARMASQRQISHTARFSRIGPRCGLRSVSENVAQALPDDRGRGVVQQWLDSSQHRAAILGRGHRVTGVGAVRRNGSWWVVQIFGRR